MNEVARLLQEPHRREIAQVPEPVLREPTIKIEEFPCPHLQGFLNDAVATCLHAGGVGLAAPQLSVSIQTFIMYPHGPRYEGPEMEPLAVLNPEILLESDALEEDREGCLSITGLRGLVKRPQQIKVRFYDRTGTLHEETFTGFAARVFCHEYDHLHGRLYTDLVDRRSLLSTAEFNILMAADKGEP